MEARDIAKGYAREWQLFALAVFMAVAFGAAWQWLQPVSYEATLLVNVGRTGIEESADYDYESFYRLQADERFADTVVRWLASPRVVSDINREAGIGGSVSPAGIDARRLSSQVIEVRMIRPKEETLRALSRSSIVVLNRYAESLNQGKPKEGWFTLIGSEPVIRDARVSLRAAFVVALLTGAFIGAWAVAIKMYFSAPRRANWKS